MREAGLETLMAREAIRDVIQRYCRAVDRMDRPLARSCWHPDGSADYRGLFAGSADALLDWMWRQHEALLGHSHQVTGVGIEQEGDRAASESYVTATLRSARPSGGPVDLVFLGRYLDRWSCREGTWAIDHRIFVGDLSHAVDVTGAHADAAPGRRDRSDPSYALLPLRRR